MYITNEEGKIVQFQYYNDDSDEDKEYPKVYNYLPEKKEKPVPQKKFSYG
jgi:hypothetical protein